MAPQRPGVTAAVCAYNEAANIGRLLQTLLERDSDCFDELIVVSSASTDGTDDIVRGVAEANPNVALIVEAERRGKASAVNSCLAAARGEVMLLIDADCLPDEGCLRRLLEGFADPAVGGVGGRNVVTNAAESPVAAAGAALWDLHHRVCLSHPVLGGDIVAFRTSVGPIPAGTVNDDYAIEAALRSRGYRIEYEAGSRVLMRAPASVRDFLSQRRRIYAGYRSETKPGLVKPTQDARLAARAVLDLVRDQPSRLPSLALLIALDLFARVWASVEALRGKRGYYTAWNPAPSTKGRLP